MEKNFDRLFRYKQGVICAEYYPGAFVSYSRGLRKLIIDTTVDPAFIGTDDAIIKHILYMSKSNHIEESPDGSYALFAVSFGNEPRFRHCLRVEYSFRACCRELDHVALMLRSEAGE